MSCGAGEVSILQWEARPTQKPNLDKRCIENNAYTLRSLHRQAPLHRAAHPADVFLPVVAFWYRNTIKVQ